MQSVTGSRKFFVKRWLSVLMLAALLLSAIPRSLQATGVQIGNAQEETVLILLGEYVQQDAADGDVFTYSILLPEEGDYLISPDDDEAAASFSVVIVNAEGDAAYEGPLDMDPVPLDAGEYTLEVTAAAESLLSFFVLGSIGGMTDSEGSPGDLYPGSIYSEADVSETRYATIDIPHLGYPQEVLIYFSAGEDDNFSLSVEGESVSEYGNSEDTEMIRFYSEGGVYSFVVDPWERKSEFTTIVFLAGAPVSLELDREIDATLASNTDTQIFKIQLDTVFDDIEITLTPAEGSETSLYLSVVERYEDGNFTVYGDTQDDGSIIASTGPVIPGDYYVVVNGYDGIETSYTLGMQGVVGAPLLSLALGEAAAGTLEDEDVQYYQLDGVDAGTFLRISLSSDAEDSDFDLSVGMSFPMDYWTSTTAGANEEVILVAPGDGAYYVQVSSYSGSGDYELLAEEIPNVGLIGTNQTLLQSVDDDGYVVYGFAIDEPGQLLSVLITSLEAEDLDLIVVHFDSTGVQIHDFASTSTGSSEIVSQAPADPGIYEVRVLAYGRGGDFALLVRVDDPATLLGGTSQGSQSQQDEPMVLLTDDFSDPTSGWAIDSENDGYVDDAYQIMVDPGSYQPVYQDDEVYSDIRLEVDVTLVSGDPEAYAGLICRTTEDGYTYLDISPIGDFTIGELVGDDVTVLTEWTESSAINTTEGAVNSMRLDCVGDTLTAYANGELLDSVAIEEGSGGFGFEAGNTETATEAAIFMFDNLVVIQP